MRVYVNFSQNCDIIMIKCGYFAALILIATTGTAHAYIDPGVGSILLQGLIAFIAAASVTIGHYWHRIKSFFQSGDNTAEPVKGQTEDRD